MSLPFNLDRLTQAQAAEYLGLINPKTLAVWRSTNRYDLPFYKIGNLVFYRRSDCDDFLERNRRGAA